MAHRMENRQRIDRARVLDAAEAVIDQHGWDHLTMAALATALGIKVPSLYNHVANLEDVRAEIQCRAIRALGAELSEAVMGKSGDAGMRAISLAFRTFARKHPHRYDGAMRAPIDKPAFFEAAQLSNNAFLAVIGGYGHDEETTLRLELAIFSSFHGAIVLENSGFFAGIVDADELFEVLLEEALHILSHPIARPLRPAPQRQRRRGTAS